MQEMKAAPAWAPALANDDLPINAPTIDHDMHLSLRLAGITDLDEKQALAAAVEAGIANKPFTLVCCCRSRTCRRGPFAVVQEC